MSEWWKNPSRNAVIYDRRHNRHIQPGEVTHLPPDPMLVLTGRLIAGGAGEVVSSSPLPAGPVSVVSALVVDDAPQVGLEIIDEPPSDTDGRRRKKG